MPPANNKHQNHVRIIAGCWRGRNIRFATQPGLRPTSNRIRETLFNWLQPCVEGVRCLDLFAGSGALGFEAVSRGASSAVMVEKNPPTARQLQQICQQLDCQRITIINCAALHWLEVCRDQFDVVFLDPPFASRQLAAIIIKLESSSVLADLAWIYIEQSSRDQPLVVPETWALRRQQLQGEVLFSLYQRSQPALR